MIFPHPAIDESSNYLNKLLSLKIKKKTCRNIKIY